MQVLRKDVQPHVQTWLANASAEEKRGVIRIARIAELSKTSTAPPPPADMPLRGGPAVIPTQLDHDARNALKHNLREDLHQHIGLWLSTASPEAKRGIVKFARVAEPRLTETIGRPQGGRPEPCVSHAPWYSQKGGHNLHRSASSPSMTFGRAGQTMLAGTMVRTAEPHEWVVPSWVHEDNHEVGKISKPGGCTLKMTDSTGIQALKNGERNNRGTYSLFSGSFVGTTTTGSVHNSEALAQAQA